MVRSTRAVPTLLLLLLTACQPAPASPSMPAGTEPPAATAASLSGTASPDSSSLSTEAATQTPPSATATPLPPMGDWREMPILPEVSPRVLEIYAAGQALGRDPHNFSVIGDCQSIPYVFLGPFGRGELVPEPAESYLWEALDYFAASFDRWAVTSRGGFTAASILNPLQADPQNCKPGETPLTCEYRLNNPAFVIITLETWLDQKTIERYENYLRQILDYVIERGSVPILLTKADAAEVDEGIHVINPAIARVAYEYQVPLVNFWKAAQYLDNAGLDPTRDGFHLSPEAYKVKNLLALRALYLVWSAVEGRDVSQVIPSGEPTAAPGQSTPEAGSGPQVNAPECGGGCIFFGTAISRDGTVTGNGVFAYAYETRTLTQVLGPGYDLQDVSEDGRRLLVNADNLLYIVSLADNSSSLVSSSFYPLGRQGAYWDSADSEVIFLDQAAPLQTETGQAINLFPSPSDGEIYFESGVCESKDFCQPGGIYRLGPGESLSRLDSYLRPVFSPDGARVAFLNPEAAVPLNYFHIGYLLLEESEGGAASRRVLYFPEEHGFMYYPEVRDYAFSPQGDRLMILYDVYSEYFEKSQALQTYLWDIGSGVLYDFGRLTGISAGLNPRQVWSPDGQKVLFFLTDVTGDEQFTISIFRSALGTGERLVLHHEGLLTGADYIYLTNLYWR